MSIVDDWEAHDDPLEPEAAVDGCWKALLDSIRKHRFSGALFYKPVCLIAAIDLTADGSLKPESMDAERILERFRAYVAVRHPERADQGWRPLWHLANDGVWTFRRHGRPVLPDAFGAERSPATRGQLLARIDDLGIDSRLLPAWCDPKRLGCLRTGLLRLMAQDVGDSRRYSRQLFDPVLARRPEAWPSQVEVDAALGVTREQLDLFGEGTGVEMDDSSGSQSQAIEVPFDPEQIDVVIKPTTVDLMLSRLRQGMIDLQPDFQRRWGIWDDGKQSRLIESLLLRIPLPVIYAAEDDDERWEIVDGIQRLSTIARFVEPGIVGGKPLVLTGLNSLQDYNGKTFGDLTEKLKLRLREAEMTVNLIRRGTPAQVKFNVFARINTGGVVLSAQEIRHAITPGQVRGLLERWAAMPAFVAATDGSVRTTRMDDRELVLRFMAFHVLGPSAYRQPDMDGFLVEAMRRINDMDEEEVERAGSAFAMAMDASYAIFGADAFRKRYSQGAVRSPINKALFETVAVALADLDPEDVRRLVEMRAVVRSRFIELCSDRAFESAITQGTGGVAKVNRRFSDMARLFRQCAAA